MGSMLIRNIPDDVMKRFKEKARASGKSAEQLAREAIAERAQPSREDLIRRSREIRAMSPPVDLEAAQRIMDEMRAERDSRPFVLGISDDH